MQTKLKALERANELNLGQVQSTDAPFLFVVKKEKNLKLNRTNYSVQRYKRVGNVLKYDGPMPAEMTNL